MTKEEMEEIYEFALKSGLAPDLVYKVGDKYSDRFENFKAFAFWVAQKEREACDAICLEVYEWAEKLLEKDDKHFAGRMRAAQDIGNAIRARGQE
jgi:hypothetical protein